MLQFLEATCWPPGKALPWSHNSFSLNRRPPLLRNINFADPTCRYTAQKCIFFCARGSPGLKKWLISSEVASYWLFGPSIWFRAIVGLKQSSPHVSKARGIKGNVNLPPRMEGRSLQQETPRERKWCASPPRALRSCRDCTKAAEGQSVRTRLVLLGKWGSRYHSNGDFTGYTKAGGMIFTEFRFIYIYFN